MAHKIDQNKVERIETPYGNGYAYGGRIYSDKQWKDILDFNAGGFKRGGPKEGEMSDAENKAYNLEMGIDDASIRADEAAINASKDALEQSYSDKNDAAEADRIARYSSASNEFDAMDTRMQEGQYNAARNQVRRDANPVSEQVRRGTGVAKGFFDETGDAENAPISLINNQTTYKKPVQEIIKQPKEGETNYNTTNDKNKPYIGSDGLTTTIRGFGSDQETLDGYNNPESNPNIDPFISKLKTGYKQPENANAGSSFADAMKSSGAFKLFEKQAKIDFEKAKKQKEIDESNRAQKAYYNNPGIGNFLNSK
jgi:hypothetical protein